MMTKKILMKILKKIGLTKILKVMTLIQKMKRRRKALLTALG